MADVAPGTFGCSPGTKSGTRVRSHVPPERKLAKTILLRNRPFVSQRRKTEENGKERKIGKKTEEARIAEGKKRNSANSHSAPRTVTGDVRLSRYCIQVGHCWWRMVSEYFWNPNLGSVPTTPDPDTSAKAS